MSKKKNYKNNNYNTNNNSHKNSYNNYKNNNKEQYKSNVNKINEDVRNDEINNEKIENIFSDDKKVAKLVNNSRKVDSTPIKKKEKKHPFVIFILIILFLISLIYFYTCLINNNISFWNLIISLLLTLFTVLFSVLGFISKKHNIITTLCSFLLISIFSISIISSDMSLTKKNGMEDFRGKSLTDVIKWSSKHKITLNQEYEYNDMVKEYHVIAQNIECGTNLDDIKEFTVSISEGPSPSKEVMIPSMISWDTERVLNFIKKNYLSNVNVEFVSSDKAKNTLIEQGTSGSLKRNDELKLTFSYGEELDFSDVSLIDLKNMTKFEAEFYMKQNQLNYEIKYDFSKKTKKGLVIKQNIAAGEKVKVNDEKVVITISKGPEIEIPDLKKLNLSEVTDWAIKNKLKLSFNEKYDDSIKENNIISFSPSEKEVVEEGTTIKLVISRGSLKMPKVKSIEDFYAWADKFEIKYEEKHEFSDSVAAGEVISYSYKAGDAIKNDDVIFITISDGSKKTVPNLKGLSKSEAISKLEKAGLNYSFVYKNSTSTKDHVLSQSISSGSEVSNGVTITVTLSNGKKTESSSSGSNTESKPSESKPSTPSPSPSPSPKPSPSPTPEEKKCNPCTITGLRNVYRENSGYVSVSNALKNHIKGQCPGITVNVYGDTTSGLEPGSPVGGFSGGDTDSCQTIEITIAK